MRILSFLKKVSAVSSDGKQETDATNGVSAAPPSQPAPAPTQSVVDAAAAAPADEAVSSASIRNSLDEMGARLIGLGESYMSIGQQLQNLRELVVDKPCAFQGFDKSIVAAVNEFEHLCGACTPEEIAAMLRQVEEAINARASIVSNNRKFVLTLEKHYYSLQLIALKGKQFFNDRVLADTAATIAHHATNKDARDLVNTLYVTISAVQHEQEIIERNIITYEQALATAIQELSNHGTVVAVDAQAALKHLHERISAINAAYEDSQRKQLNFTESVNQLMQDEASVIAKAKSVDKQTDALMDESSGFRSMILDSINLERYGIPGSSPSQAPAASSSGSSAESADTIDPVPLP